MKPSTTKHSPSKVGLRGLTNIVDDENVTSTQLEFARNGLARHVAFLRSSSSADESRVEATLHYLQRAEERLIHIPPRVNPEFDNRRLIGQGNDVDEDVSEYLESRGVTPRNITRYAEAWGTEVTVSDVLEAEAAGVTSHTAVMFADEEIHDRRTVMRLVRAGIVQSPISETNILNDYRQAGWRDVDDILSLAEIGVSSEESKVWRRLGVSSVEKIANTRKWVGAMPSERPNRSSWYDAVEQRLKS